MPDKHISLIFDTNRKRKQNPVLKNAENIENCHTVPDFVIQTSILQVEKIKNKEERGIKRKNLGESIKNVMEFITVVCEFILTIIPVLFAIVSALFHVNIDTEQPKEIENNVQNFYVEEEIQNVMEIEYIQYTLKSDPIIACYQVKPYPYIAIRISNGWKYILLLHQYTQDQYVSTSDGICYLMRENTTEEIQNLSKEVLSNLEIKTGCFLAIRYVTAEKNIETYALELRTGNLIDADKNTVLEIFRTLKTDECYTIETYDWPNNEKLIEEQLKKIQISKE